LGIFTSEITNKKRLKPMVFQQCFIFIPLNRILFHPI
jgi:hypothetical protein